MISSLFCRFANSSDSWHFSTCGKVKQISILYEIPDTGTDSIDRTYSSATSTTKDDIYSSKNSYKERSTNCSFSSIKSPTAAWSSKPSEANQSRQELDKEYTCACWQWIYNAEYIKKTPHLGPNIEKMNTPVITIGTDTWLHLDIQSSELQCLQKR